MEVFAYVANHARHHAVNRAGRDKAVRRVDHTEHTLLAMGGDTTVEECRVSIIDNLSEDEALVLDTRSEGTISSLVANCFLR